jgi:hypothetical protein
MGDAGIVQFTQLPALKWLDLTASNPSEDTVKALTDARPNLEVLSSAN